MVGIFVGAFYITLFVIFLYRQGQAHGWPGKKRVQLYTDKLYVEPSQSITDAGAFFPRISGRFVNMEDKP